MLDEEGLALGLYPVWDQTLSSQNAGLDDILSWQIVANAIFLMEIVEFVEAVQLKL